MIITDIKEVRLVTIILDKELILEQETVVVVIQTIYHQHIIVVVVIIRVVMPIKVIGDQARIIAIEITIDHVHHQIRIPSRFLLLFGLSSLY